MKHELNRLGPDGFEQMIQALMSKLFGIRVKIYGDGPDRQREAVIDNAHYLINDSVEVLGRTIVQAKYKSSEGKQTDWTWLRSNIKKELDSVAKEAKKEPTFIPNTWLFFTNVILTPGKGGVKDKADGFVANYKHLIPNIYILGADEIRSLLDANSDVARRYAAFLTPGDVLADALDYLGAIKLESLNGLIEYVYQRFRADEPVRLEQAGNVAEGSIAVRNVYTDLEAEGELAGKKHIDGLAAAILRLGNRPHPRESCEDRTTRQTGPENNLVLIGNAGQGKSTFCQYICQLYRASLLEHYRPEVEAAHNYAEHSGVGSPKCERFPVLIRLKEYAAWIRKMQTEGKNYSVLHYLVFLMARDGIVDLSVPSVRELLKSYSWVFFFDGLDEVPASSNRSELIRQIDLFLSQDLTEAKCDSLVICTSRPQGYDSAFSPLNFRRLELKEMSPEYCLRYIDRLLNYLEQSSDYREKYRSILVKALDDPLVAKLMTTPLYTAILVLLVKSGSTPPTRRYELFNKYSEIVLERELQKELLPSLYDGDYAWVKEVHGLIAYLLQSESETADNAAAELDSERCHMLIRAYLEDEHWQGDKGKKEDELYRAMTERLPFLAETTDADSKNCVLFPLRSLQEYFAAEHLLLIEDPEKRSEMLEALSFNLYWRNVFLFVAGYYSKNDSRSVNDSIYAICMRNNGDTRFGGGENVACQIALPGSRLALDLLRDNLFERRGGQERYLELAAELLVWEYSDDSPAPTFMKLPPVLLDRFIQDWAIPRVREAKDPNEAAFELVYMATLRGNPEAKDCLEYLADELLAPAPETLSELLRLMNPNTLSVKLLHYLIKCVIDIYPDRFSFYDDSLWMLLDNCRAAEKWGKLPDPVRRLIVYDTLKGFRFSRHIDRSKFSDLYNMLHQDKLLSYAILVWEKGLSRARLGTSSCFTYVPPECVETWRGFSEFSRREGFPELAALAAYHSEPTIVNLSKLLAVCQEMPDNLRQSLYDVLREQNLLLRKYVEAADAGEKPDDFLARCDEAYVQSIQEREKAIIAAVSKDDYATLNELNAWTDLNRLFLDDESWLPAAISTANNKSCKKILSSLHPMFEPEKLSDDLRRAILQRFPLAFHTWNGTTVALIAFSQEATDRLANQNLSYPNYVPQMMAFVRDRTVISDIVDRVHALSTLGGDYLNVYSLVPNFFHAADHAMLNSLSEKAAERFDAVKAIGNVCALRGVILLILTGEIPKERREELFGELRHLMIGVNPSGFDQYFRQFSLEGKLLAHEAGMEIYRGTKWEKLFYSLSRCAILQSLETLSVDRSKLPTPCVLACV